MRSNKVVKLAAVVLLVALATVPAQARGKKVHREVSAEYVAPAGVFIGQSTADFEGGVVACKSTPSCLALEVPDEATSVAIEIADRTGLTAMALIGGVAEEEPEVCGSTKQPLNLEVPVPHEITITLLTGTCRDGTPSFVTAGTVTATFTSGPTE